MTLRGAATALTPQALISWASGGAGGSVPATEVAAGAGSVGLTGLIVKGAVVAVSAGALVGGVAVTRPDPNHGRRAPVLAEASLSGPSSTDTAGPEPSRPSGENAQRRAIAAADSAGGQSQAATKTRRHTGRSVRRRLRRFGDPAGRVPGSVRPRARQDNGSVARGGDHLSAGELSSFNADSTDAGGGTVGHSGTYGSASPDAPAASGSEQPNPDGLGGAGGEDTQGVRSSSSRSDHGETHAEAPVGGAESLASATADPSPTSQGDG
jgi:hypothetical protein